MVVSERTHTDVLNFRSQAIVQKKQKAFFLVGLVSGLLLTDVA